MTLYQVGDAMRSSFRFSRLLLFVLAALCLAAAPARAANADKGGAGKIPSLSAQGILDIVQQNRGKVIFINFFATWCPPCREEIPDLIKVRAFYPEDKLLLIGVSLDEDLAKLKSFAARTGFNYPIYLADDEVAPIVGISSIPHNLVYDPEGKLVASEAGMVDEESVRALMDILLANKPKAGKKSGGEAK